MAAGALDALVTRHGLVHDDAGPFTLRATGMPLDVVAEIARAAPVLAALDLAESLDVRDRRRGAHRRAGAVA